MKITRKQELIAVAEGRVMPDDPWNKNPQERTHED
jgi:hypothetical protein